MDTVYYDGQELKNKIEHSINRYYAESIEFKPCIINSDFETFKNKYRLIYGKEFEEIEVIDETHLILNLTSNDNKIHLKGSLKCLFNNCERVKTLDLSCFDTSNVVDMNGMFVCCDNLENLDISSFDTSKVDNMFGLFAGCKSIETLDLLNFNTSNVTTIGYMFYECKSLKTLNISSFDISKVDSMKCIFYNTNISTLITNEPKLLKEYSTRDF